MAANQPSSSSSGPGLRRPTFGSQEWHELLKQQFGDNIDAVMEDSPLFRLTSDGAFLDELIKTLSTGEGDDLGSHLFSDKTLNALMGAQMQQVAEEEQQQLEAARGTGDDAVQKLPASNPLDAALALLHTQPQQAQQDGHHGDHHQHLHPQQAAEGWGDPQHASTTCAAADASVRSSPPRSFHTLQEAAEAIGLIPRTSPPVSSSAPALPLTGSGSSTLSALLASLGGAGTGSPLKGTGSGLAAALLREGGSTLASWLGGDGADVNLPLVGAGDSIGALLRGEHASPSPPLLPQQQAQRAQQAASPAAPQVSLVDGQVVSKDGTVLLGPLPTGQQLQLQVPSASGGLDFIPVLDSRVISLPSQQTQQQFGGLVGPDCTSSPPPSPGQAAYLQQVQAAGAAAAAAAMHAAPDAATLSPVQAAQQTQQLGAGGLGGGGGFSFSGGQQAQQVPQQDSIPLPPWLQQPAGNTSALDPAQQAQQGSPPASLTPEPSLAPQGVPVAGVQEGGGASCTAGTASTAPGISAFAPSATAAAAAGTAALSGISAQLHSGSATPSPGAASQHAQHVASRASSGALAAAAAATAQVASLPTITPALPPLPKVASQPALSSLPSAASPPLGPSVAAAMAISRAASLTALSAPVPLHPPQPLQQLSPLARPEALVRQSSHSPSASPTHSHSPPPGAHSFPTSIADTNQLLAAAAAQQQLLRQRAASGQLSGGPGAQQQAQQHAQQLAQQQQPILYSNVALPAQQAQQAQQGLFPPSPPIPILHPLASSTGAQSVSHSMQHPCGDSTPRSCPEAAVLGSHLPPHAVHAQAHPPLTQQHAQQQGGRPEAPTHLHASWHQLAQPHAVSSAGGRTDGNCWEALEEGIRGGQAGAGGSGSVPPTSFTCFPPKPLHKRERSIRSANIEGIAPEPKAGRSGMKAALLDGGVWGAQCPDPQAMEESEGRGSLLATESSEFTAGGGQSPVAATSIQQGNTPRYYSNGPVQAVGGSFHAASSQQLLVAAGSGDTAAAAALLMTSPLPPAKPADGTPPTGARAAAGGRRGRGRAAGGGGCRAKGAAGPTASIATAPASSSSVDDEEVKAIIARALARPPGKRRGRPPGRRNGMLPPEVEAELEEAAILKELLQDPEVRALPIEELKRLMRKEKNKKMAAFSRTKNVMHVTELEEKVRRLSEERDWLVNQLVHGPPSGPAPHRFLVAGGFPVERPPLSRNLSM